MLLPRAFRSFVFLALLPATLRAQDPAELAPDLRAALHQAVLESSYRITQAGEGCDWQAFNSAQGVRSTFTVHEGVRIDGGDAESAPWGLNLALESWGRPERLVPVEAAEPVPTGRRVEYCRGPLTEWYVNDERGLVQGFTVQVAPEGDGPLCLALSISAGFRAEILPGGRDAVLIDPEGALLRYAGLRAWDSAQRELEASLAVDEGRLALCIEDEAAVYPLHIDPLICAEEAILEPGNSMGGDRFGRSVAFFGDTVVVGAPRDTRSGGADAGSANVFVRNGATWSEEQQLIPSDAQLDDRFGFSVSLYGDTAVVGAYLEDHGSATEAGAAYVFVRNGTIWSEQQKLVAFDFMDGDRFGIGVSIWGDTVAVGSFRDDSPAADAGSVYVFVRSGTSWNLQQKLVAGDAASDDRLGIFVDVEGDTVVAGAPRDDHGGLGSLDRGSAYVFVRSGTSWSQQQKLVASDSDMNDNFGWTVALSGETALVGSPRDNHVASDAGSAYVFVRSGTTWSEEQKLVASDALTGDGLGMSVALSGDTAVVGAPFDDHAIGTDAGSVYVFGRSGTSWSQLQKLAAGQGTAFDLMGISSAVLGDTAIVGVPRDDLVGDVDSGSTYVFRLHPPLVTYCTPGTSASGCQAMASASGAASLSAPAGFVLTAVGVEGAKDGAFYFGTSGKQANPWGNGTSFQCVVAPVQRTGLLTGTGTVGFCDGSFTRDMNAFWCASCPFSNLAPAPGTLVQAQFWYRDPANTSSKKTSLSNAIEFCVAP